MNKAKTTVYVYVFSNNWFTRLFKIGSTTNVYQRRASLGRTSVPDDYEIVFTLNVTNYKNAEKTVQQMLNLYRYAPNKEFFGATKIDIKKVLINVAKLTGGIIHEYQGNKKIQIYPKIKISSQKHP
ncbi:MAG: GIY-YIG nuclease family protein [Bacteroidales bacterium]|nr:GIY-YIG nuclease family protein [Bacteroidales bacterium]